MTLDVLTLTRKLLGFETINPPGDERACALYLGSLLETAGYETRYYEFADKRSNLIARLAGRDEKLPICFTGHLDTVPLGSTSWSRDPFAGETDGDKLYGRGTSDMKSGVAAMVLMALRLARQANRRAGITLIFTAGEETTCERAGYLASLDNLLGSPVRLSPVIRAPMFPIRPQRLPALHGEVYRHRGACFNA
ncbi:MAG TPA: M20/M25/M40 family metallo-hydrolase [Candidatus Binatia bacterium]